MIAVEERFGYDANLNIREQSRLPRGAMSSFEQVQQRQARGRVVSRGEDDYRYDAAGRLTEKCRYRDGYRPQRWRYRWDAHDRLSELMTPSGVRWRYSYDPFGRRIRKQKVSADNGADTRPAGKEYRWSGDQMIAETPVYADGTAAYDEGIHWLYAPGALTPAARYQKGQLHYVVSDHMGTPRELLTEQGKVAWAGRLSTWGEVTEWPVAANDADKLSCNLRFAGQYADEESGLHYNRFRYYDNGTGQYLSPDPIGLAGGVNLYAYVPNPLKYADPFGLCKVDNARARQAQMLKDNVGYNISPKNWDQYPALGQYGTFVTDKQGALKYFPGVQNSEVTISKSLAATIEKDMGLPPGSLSDGFNIRKIDGISSMQPRSPLGGNDYFLGPGQHLPGGAPEVVVEPVSPTTSITIGVNVN